MTQGNKPLLQQDIRSIFGLEKKISKKHKLRFFRALTNLLGAGIPVLTALSLLRTKIKDPALLEIGEQLQGEVSKGQPLSKAMRLFPSAFTKAEIGLIMAGENTGTIETSLGRISENLEKEVSLRSKVISTLLYPSIIIGLLVVVLCVIVFYVLPTLTEVFDSQGINLPAGLVFSKAIFDFVQSYWWLIFIIIIGVITAITHTVRTNEQFKYNLQYKLLQLPIYGNILRKSTVVLFMTTFGTLLESGMPLMDAISILAGAQQLLPYKHMLEEMKKGIASGQSISQSISKDENIIPEDVYELIAIGERTASLKEMFFKVAAQYEFELDIELKNVTTLIEPISLLCVAVLIGFFAFTILGSIFDLLNSLT